jgi:hypothetical protein
MLTTTIDGRYHGPTVTLDPTETRAVLTGTADAIPGTTLARGLAFLAEVTDAADPTTILAALRFPGARDALAVAVNLCQHGETFADAASDEGDGTVLASFLSLAVASANLTATEDEAVVAHGGPFSGPETAWRSYVEGCGRVALVRSLRAVYRPDAGPSNRDALYRTPNADDPSVTAPRAPRASRSPGSKVANVPRSRSERTRDAIARAARVTADAMGSDLPPLVTFGQSVVGDPHCPLALVETDDDGPRHACSPRCFGLGGMHAYSPRQGRAHVTLPAGQYGPVLTADEGTSLVWRPFRAFPDGVAYQRGHADTGTDARTSDRGKVRLVWRPGTARQYVTSDGRRFTPGTFRRASADSLVIPTRTAAHLAAGGTFDTQCVTVYQGVTFVGNGPALSDQRTPSKRTTVATRATRERRTLTTQQRAVITLVVDAVTLTMYDGRPRTAHRDDQGRGYVVTRTSDGVLSLLTPSGVTTPLPTDPRKVTSTVRAAIVAG